MEKLEKVLRSVHSQILQTPLPISHNFNTPSGNTLHYFYTTLVQVHRDAGSLNYHRACQLSIKPEKHRQNKADAARRMQGATPHQERQTIENNPLGCFGLFAIWSVPTIMQQLSGASTIIEPANCPPSCQTDAAYIWEPATEPEQSGWDAAYLYYTSIIEVTDAHYIWSQRNTPLLKHHYFSG